MKYELAKKLKDAGFKVESHDCWEKGCQSNDGVCYPTLSELIEACGKMSLFSYRGQKVWQAEGGELYVNKETMQGGYKIRVIGLTPEEAVAELWLALNKK